MADVAAHLKPEIHSGGDRVAFDLGYKLPLRFYLLGPPLKALSATGTLISSFVYLLGFRSPSLSPKWHRTLN